jgi:DNA-binding NarL/FixJ family response regulator
MTRVLLYSDEPMLAEGLKTVLGENQDFDLLPTSTSLPSVMAQLEQDAPDLVLMDLTTEITFAVLSSMKAAMSRSKIVLWVNAISTELAYQAMGLGVRGILRKTLPLDLQVKCLRKVQLGELWFEKGLTDSFLGARRVALTQREGQLVSLLSQGLKNKEIAATLTISEGTVKVYLSRLFQKVGVKDRFELALFGLKNLTTGQLPVGEMGQRLLPTAMPGLRSLVIDHPLEESRVQAPPEDFGPSLRPAEHRA